MTKILLGLCFAILLSSFTVAPAMAQVGPLSSSAKFTPRVPYNPTCTIKVDPPVPSLGVVSYDKKIFGYVRYCAVKTKAGQIKGQIIHEFTNGNNAFISFSGKKGLCATQIWLSGDGTEVLRVDAIDYSSQRSDHTTATDFLLSPAEFSSVRKWVWNFHRC